MQDRYAGDVGDFGKFAVLRALSASKLGELSDFAGHWSEEAELFR